MSIISTFCLTSIIFLIIPVHSYTPYTYDPWLDVNDDGKINLVDTFTTDLAYGTTGDPTKNVNVTNWPQDRPLIIKKGVEKITLVQAMDGGSGNGFALSLGKVGTGPGLPTVSLVYDFEPNGQFVNVSEIYLNYVWRGDVAGSVTNPHNVSMFFYKGPSYWSGSFDSIDLSGALGQPWDTMPIGPWLTQNAVSDFKYGFNFTAAIQPGMNLAILSRQDNYGDHIYIFSLEMFIEYYYWG